MAVQPARKPRELRCHPGTTTLSCVLAQAVYVWRLTEDPRPARVDNVTGRSVRNLPMPTAVKYLVGRGLRVIELGPNSQSIIWRRPAVAADIHTLLDLRWTIIATFRVLRDRDKPCLLVPQGDGRKAWVYVPRRDGDTTYEYEIKKVAGSVRLSNGLHMVALPGADRL